LNRLAYRTLLALLLGIASAVAGAAGVIERIEPAHWWAGMKNPRLQLLVHGEGIATFEPAIADSRVTLRSVIRTANPNYLFIDLLIAGDATPGSFEIAFRRGGRTQLKRSYELKARLPGSADRRGFGPADALYLAMPDRFANGDASNDSLPGLAERANRMDPDGRHGGDLEGLRARLDYVAGMGFTQLWLNPVLESNQPLGSYHGYAITDFYRVDPRLGDNALYARLSKDARDRGIGLVMDVILNHCGSGHWWMKDLPDTDWIHHGGRFVGTTHRRETQWDPHASQSDTAAFTDGWFVPAMPDLNQRHPQLATYLIQNTIWWVETARLSGLRVDTLPYSDRGFLAQWRDRVLEEYPALSIVGEEWSVDPAIVSRWQQGPAPGDERATTPVALMDFPLQHAFVRALTEPESRETGLLRIYQALAGDFLYADPGHLVVFPDNHDMSRIHTQLGASPARWKMAMAFFATVRGSPQFTWGSEILMANPGTDAHGVIRQDFPGGWPDDAADAVKGEGLAPAARDAQEYLRRLLTWRKGASAVHGGSLTQYAPDDGTYVFARRDAHQVLLVAFNRNETARRLDAARFAESVGRNTHARDVLSGREFELASGVELAPESAAILELSGAPPVPAGVTGKLETVERFTSRFVDARRVDVWLPPSYGRDAARRFPVLYMHDGQNLFDPAFSYTGVDWGLDEAVTQLSAEGRLREAIVVGIWNTPKRFAEYMPAKAMTESGLPDDWPDMAWMRKHEIVSDDYLRFIVEELKPHVDTNYRTLPGRDDTAIMGSSMGALISLYALLEYPAVFGGAGCVSIHWPLGDGLVADYLAANQLSPKGHRLYFDHGTATLDAGYAPYQRRVDAMLRAAGWRDGKDFLTYEDAGAAHDERAWRARLAVPLEFLLGAPAAQKR
jgi:glycosidase/predicted alpha/beta superfamily hydrolase